MSYAKRGVRALGLALLVAFGLVILLTSGGKANWLVLKTGTELAANENLSVSSHSEFNLLIPAQKLEILCGTVASDGLKLVAKSTLGEGAITFTSCKVWQSGKISSNCKPAEPILLGLTAHLILFNSLSYVLIEPLGTGPFTVLKFGGLCPLPKEVEVAGSLLFECVKADLGKAAKLCEGEATTHYLTQAEAIEGEETCDGPEEFPKDKILWGENETAFTGIMAIKLSGPNETGQTWAGHI